MINMKKYFILHMQVWKYEYSCGELSLFIVSILFIYVYFFKLFSGMWVYEHASGELFIIVYCVSSLFFFFTFFRLVFLSVYCWNSTDFCMFYFINPSWTFHIKSKGRRGGHGRQKSHLCLMSVLKKLPLQCIHQDAVRPYDPTTLQICCKVFIFIPETLNSCFHVILFKKIFKSLILLFEMHWKVGTGIEG